MQKIYAISFLDAFISNALVIIIPLLLLSRNIDLLGIGIILSLLPFVFLFGRTFFALAADEIGVKIFFIINWLSNSISVLFYFFAQNVLWFLGGKFFEGVRDAAYWSVSRTAVYKLSKKGREAENSAKVSGVIYGGAAVGVLVAGFLLNIISFENALLVIFAISLLLSAPVLLLKFKTKISKFDIKKAIESAISKKRNKKFWGAAIAMAFLSISTYPLYAFILTTYMKKMLGFDYWRIGLFFSVLNIIICFSLFVGNKIIEQVKLKYFLAIQTILFLVGVYGISEKWVYFIVLLGIGWGFGEAIFERIIAEAAARSNQVSTDIAILHIPIRFAEFATVISAGAIAQFFGYIAIFAYSAVFFFAFALLSYAILRNSSFI